MEVLIALYGKIKPLVMPPSVSIDPHVQIVFKVFLFDYHVEVA
jgi:hypothetical protein